MRLEILSLKGIEFEGEAAAFNVKTLSGEITILNHHRPMITALDKGTARLIQTDGQEKTINIKSGFLEMTPHNHLKVLVD
ncbi:MAG: F0F1 ATP synthase subunit epsilon [Patescibacteria group bacterium]